MLVTIAGPVRSGKSARAECVAVSLGVPVSYVATARIDPGDPEMADRIARHQADRGPQIGVIELWSAESPALAALVTNAPPRTTLLIDSLGTWIAGHLLDLELVAQVDAAAALRALEAATAPLVPAVQAARANVVIVIEETGWGLVPPSPLGRIFRDHLGRLSAALAGVADRAELVVAGYALDLKRLGTRIAP